MSDPRKDQSNDGLKYPDPPSGESHPAPGWEGDKPKAEPAPAPSPTKEKP